MPGILPMRVIRVEEKCEHCASQDLECDRKRPKCSHCFIAKITCERVSVSCDRCRSKKIRCDRNRPSCTQCTDVGFDCKFTDKRLRRAFPRAYTESLEDRVRILEAETRELKDLLDEKDDRIDTLTRVASETQTVPRRRMTPSRLEPGHVSEWAAKHLHVYTFGVETTQVDKEEVPVSKQIQNIDKTQVSKWVEDKVRIAGSNQRAPAINLLVIETPDDSIEEASSLLQPRNLYDEVLLLTKPALDSLGISSNVLGTFGSAVFDRSSLSVLHFRHLDAVSVHTFTYHIALGFFSLAFRYFPKSKTCVGILLAQNQNYTDVAAEILRDLNTHQALIGQPLLLPLLAQQAMTKLIASWLTQHREVIIDAQAQTGYHHMVSLRKSPGPVDYTELSAKISGTAVNIATNELCWQALVEHADYMVEEMREERDRLDSKPKSVLEPAVASFVEHHASRVARNSRAMLREAESWQKKALILVQGIFNLIAQQDQNTSIGIARDSKTVAEESKRDSTSMKTIAIVTMTYLPGTFAASLFSMSMFDWEATNGKDVVSHRFWVYWAVTIPLILVTFLVWIAWMRYKGVERTPWRWTK